MMQIFSRWRGALCAAVLTVALLVTPARADVPFRITMNYDVTGTGQYNQYYNDFAITMNAIERLLVSWSGPRAIESQYSGFTIDIAFEDIDGEFGVLAQAGPTDILRWGGPGYAKHGTSGAVVRAGTSTYDINDMGFMAATGILRTVIMHETFHALGFPGVWDDFGYRSRNGLGFVGPNALAAYREATGQPYAPYVPVEQGGGGGTAGGHWSMADPYFFNPLTGEAEVMIGFIDGSFNSFLSDVTLAQFRDLGYLVPSLGGGRLDSLWPSGPVLPKQSPDGDAEGGGGAGGDGGDGGLVTGDGPLGKPSGSGDDDGSSGPRRGQPGTTGGMLVSDDGSPLLPGMPGFGADGQLDWGKGGLLAGGLLDGGSGGVFNSSGVPEPSSLLILAAAAGFHLVGRRRR